jgi:plastocyanin
MSKLASVLLRGRPLALAILVLTLAGSAGLIFGNSPGVSAAAKYTVFAGGGRAGISVDAFRPGVVNVNVGDTVDFTNPYEEIHTVTFLAGKKIPELIEAVPPTDGRGPPTIRINPDAAKVVKADSFDGSAGFNSGVLNKGQSFSVTFKQGGSFQLVCIVHPFMTATVNVLPAGTFVASQAQRDAEAATILDNVAKAGEAAAASLRATQSAGAGGTSSWKLSFPPPGNAPYAVNRFVPSRLSIGVGDSVTWDNNVEGPPHTVTFLGGTAAPAPIMPAASGDLVIPPNVAFPTPQKTYEGTGYTSSGIIQKAPGSPPSYTLTFPKAGTYSYICLLHADQGMAGVVEVGGGSTSAGGGTITPPSTGDAGLVQEASMTAWLLAAAAVLVFGLGGLAVIKVRLDG